MIGDYMSQRKREAPPPASAAGLLRFFEDSISGIKVNPMYLTIGTIVFIAVSLAIRFLFPVA
jgi:preprotein translocase subunit Sec61beta